MGLQGQLFWAILALLLGVLVIARWLLDWLTVIE